MKFVCDQCSTKYSIDDGRVRGKVLKIRCKQCSHIITVREEMAAISGPVAAPASATAPNKALEKALDHSFSGVRGGASFDVESTQVSSPAHMQAVLAAVAKAGPSAVNEEWFVSFDGEQEGPHPFDKMLARIRVEKGKEVFCWKDGFEGWLPVAKVPEIVRALRPVSGSVAIKPLAPGAAVVKPAPSIASARVAQPVTAKAESKPAPQAIALAIAEIRPAAVSAPIKPARPVSEKASAHAVSEGATQSDLPAPSAAALGARPQAPSTQSVAPRNGAAAAGIAPAVAPTARPSTPEPVKLAASGSVAAKKAEAAEAKLAPTAERNATPPEAVASRAPAKLESVQADPATPAIHPAKADAPSSPPGIGEPLIAAVLEKSSAAEAKPTHAAAEKSSAVKAKPPIPIDAAKSGPNAAKPPIPIAAAKSGPAAKSGAVVSKPPVPEAASIAKSAPIGSNDSAGGIAARAVEESTPTPLPPPPANDLLITEASVVMPMPLAPSGHRSHSAQPSPPSPVVIITGPAPGSTAAWIKWAAVGSLALIILLSGTVGWLLYVRKPISTPVSNPAVATNPVRRVDVDTPATALDDHPRILAAPDPQQPGPKTAPPPIVQRKGPGAPMPNKAGPKLTQEQIDLARIYQQTSDSAKVHDMPAEITSARGDQNRVDDNRIMAVVSGHKRDLSDCYDTVLRRTGGDPGLRRAKIDIEVTVGISGRAKEVNIGGVEGFQDLIQCLTRRIHGWTFPSQGSEYKTSFPVHLQAQ